MPSAHALGVEGYYQECAVSEPSSKHPAPPPKSNLRGCLAIIGLIVLGAIILVGIRSMVGEASPVADITAR